MNDKELMTSERRAADIQQVLGEINRFLDLHPHVLHKEGPGKNIFFAHGCKDNVTGDFTVWVIKNREPVELHFLEDYFDPIERQQIYSRLEPLVMPNPPMKHLSFLKI